MFSSDFDPTNSYWIVAGDDARVYSSRRNVYVEATDPEYVAWREATGFGATSVDSEATIWFYTQAYLPEWMFDGATFSQPAEGQYTDAQIAACQAAARAKMIGYADQITARITASYPAAEVASWPTQEAEARAVLAGGGTEAAPLLTGMAAAAGMSLDDFAESVLIKAAQYRVVVVAVQAIRSATEDAINAAGSPEAVAAALDGARAMADARAAELGLAG